MLTSCIIDFKGKWNKHLLLVELLYNNSFYSSISIAPYEFLYGRRCGSPIGWFEVFESSLVGLDLIITLWRKFIS